MNRSYGKNLGYDSPYKKVNEPGYMTGTPGVKKTPDEPDNKEAYVIDTPKHST